MKTAPRRWFLIFALALTVAGCATEKINWQARVGNYTYDQAVSEYGQPDHRDKLPDGTLIADWMLHAGHDMIARPSYMNSANEFGPAMPAFNFGYMPSYYMRLTFGPDGKLRN